MFRAIFFRLVLPLLTASSACQGLEPFIPQPDPPIEARPNHLVAHGGTWAAFPLNHSTIRVVDRTTRQTVRDFVRPADDTPIAGRPGYVRSLGSLGRSVAADGDRMAVICDSTVERLSPYGVEIGMSVLLWEVSTGTLIGVADLAIPQNGNIPYIGLANGKLVVADTFQRKLWRWDSASMAALSPLVVPDALPAPDNSNFGGGTTVLMAGNHLVYLAPYHQSTASLVNVDLTQGTFTTLPLPSDYYGTEVGSGFAMNGNALVFPCRTGSPFPFPTLLHFDLDSSQLTGRSDFTESRYYQAQIRPVVSPTGAWHASVIPYGSDVEFISGTSATAPYQAMVRMGSFGASVSAPYAFVDGKVWFYPNSLALPKVISYFMTGGGLPETKISGQCLPCTEADGTLQVKVSLSEADTAPVSFRVRTKDGSAIAPGDFTELDQVFTIAAGETEKLIDITLTRDQVIEKNESLFIEITDASSNALIAESQFAGVIGGSSFNLLPPVAPWSGGSEAKPTGVSLAGGRLIQANQRTSEAGVGLPPIVTKPFGSGDWTPSANWGRTIPPNSVSIRFLANDSGRALLREYSAVSVFDPNTDQVLFRLNDAYGDNGTEAFCDSFIVSGMGTNSSSEYPLTPPHTPRSPAGNLWLTTAAYTQDYLIMHQITGALQKYSKADGSDLGPLFTSGPWSSSPALSGEGNLLAIASGNQVWICDVTAPNELKTLTPLNTSFSEIGAIDIDGGRVFVTDRRYGLHPLIRVFDPSSGVEIDTLLEDIAATVLPGSAELPDSVETPRFNLAPFSVEGPNAVASFEWDGFHIPRFSESADLPSLSNPPPLRENSGTLQVSFTEAAPYPITVTSQVIAAGRNEAADWSGAGTAVVIPAGSTSFDSGLSVVNDPIPEEGLVAALELTLVGNGKTEVRRISVEVTDDDLMSIADIPTVEMPMGRTFAPVGSGWAYQSRLNGDHLVSWTGDESFSQISPVGPLGAYSFAFTMAGTGDWLAVTQENYGGKLGNQLPSRVYVYRPGDRKTPFYFIKGQKYIARFGDELYARGNYLWVGAPGSEAFVTEVKSQGAAYLYDIRNGKKLKTYKAPKGQTMSFGETITANDQSVWIAAPWINSRTGMVHQYSMDKGKHVRTILSPVPGTGRFFGEEMVATNDLLIVSSKPTTAPDAGFRGAVHGFSATTGAHLWTGTSSDNDSIGHSLAILPGNILAVGGSSLYFYELMGDQPPRLIVQIKGSSNIGFSELQLNGFSLACQQTDIFDQAKADVFDLRDIPKLQSYLGTTPSPFQRSASDRQGMTLKATAAGWQLDLPRLPYPADPPGKKTLLEASTDLVEWVEVARYAGADSWVPSGDLATGLPNGWSFLFPNDVPARYFRLNLVADPGAE